MTTIKFSAEERKTLGNKLQLYLKEKLDTEIGQFDADFLLDFISDEIGAYYYNRGLLDAQAVLESRVESIVDALYEIELPTEFSK